MASEKLTEYERRRLENIRRNDEMMAALKVHAKASLLSAATKRRRIECKTNTEAKKNRPETPIVTRRSLRTRKLPESVRSPEPSPGVNGPLTFEAAYKLTGSDKQFIDTILGIAKKSHFWKRDTVECGSIKACKDDESSDTPPVTNGLGRCTPSSGRLSSVSKNEITDSSSDSSVKQGFSDFRVKHEKSESGCVLDLAALTLEPENVARVMPGRIWVVKFLPCADVTMVASGNNYGHVGFWNLDSKDEEEHETYLYRPHTGIVSSILFQQSSLSKVITSCYGGLIRLMDVQKSVFDLVYSGNDAIFSLSQCPNDEQSLYFGEGYGKFNIWDLRAGKSSFYWDLHEHRINSVDFNPQMPHVMATSSSDGTACLWDLRSMGAEKPMTLDTVNHVRAVHSAYFSPSGLSLATTSIDNYVGILGGSNFEDLSVIYHDNQTGSSFPDFRGTWGWDDSYIFIGNAGRGVDVISPAQNRTVMTLQSPLVSATPSRLHSHPLNVGMLAGATPGGQVCVWEVK